MSSSSTQTGEQQQQQQREYHCFTCREQVVLRRKTDDSGWDRFATDGITPHVCNPERVRELRKGSFQKVSSSMLQLHEKLDKIESKVNRINDSVEVLLRQQRY